MGGGLEFAIVPGVVIAGALGPAIPGGARLAGLRLAGAGGGLRGRVRGCVLDVREWALVGGGWGF
jgi:hypothetical protein